jgi:hypothetical protein
MATVKKKRKGKNCGPGAFHVRDSIRDDIEGYRGKA